MNWLLIIIVLLLALCVVNGYRKGFLRMMSECAKSFERLPILLHADILRNILYSGVWSRYEYLQLRKKKLEEKKTKRKKEDRKK